MYPLVSTSLCLCLFIYCVTAHSAFDDFLYADTSELELENGNHNQPNTSWSDEVAVNISTIAKIYAYTREYGDNYTEILYGNISTFYESGFDTNKTTKMLIHGWRGSAFTTFETVVRQTYQSAQDVNILTVDWSIFADGLYAVARRVVVPVGKLLAKVLDWLSTEGGVSLGSFHIVGHSLGAHIAGAVGEHVTAAAIGRISGLDPAGPGFELTSTSGRLDSTDALFVDVIHTCGHGAGYFDPCGHVDFYPNQGTPPQPGCEPPLLVCSHARSYEFFNESITSESFVSTSCDDWQLYCEGACDGNLTVSMGEHVDTSARGKFYLHTESTYPYAVGNGTTLQDEEH